MTVREPLLPTADEWCRQGLAAAEAKRLVRLAGPMITSCLLQNIINILSLMFVEHLGELPLAGASLANSVASVTGFNIIVRPFPYSHHTRTLFENWALF
jgi:MATE family multidrug resistance protein